MSWRKSLAYKVVSVEVVKCRDSFDQEHDAVVIVYEDGSVEVRCPGGCYGCPYGKVVGK